MSTIAQKLRAILVAAQRKIHKNRHKNIPGKWPADSFNDLGERTWNTMDPSVLILKFKEECGELLTALEGEPAIDILYEAGDVMAMSMMLVDRVQAFEKAGLAPKIVCLCGSTRFKDHFLKAQLDETLAGNIILSVGCFMHADSQLGLTISDETKVKLDTLHLHKIDLADEILVINVDGYIGTSTTAEIIYAIKNGKGIRYLEPDKPLTLTIHETPSYPPGCDHDFTTDEQGFTVPDDSVCKKCGMSFLRYIHTECP